MAPVSTSSVISCRWDWCRVSLSSIATLDTHVKHEHIWPMKPMRKAEVALMRRMDLQSLHSSPNTDSRGVSLRSRTPPLAVTPTPTLDTHDRPENEAFDTFAQLSSPPQTHSPQMLPASPALEGLIMRDGRSGLPAAVEAFERTNSHRRPRLPSHQRSPTLRPFSHSSGSSQEVVEQHLTQEDDVGSQPQPLLPPESHIENELADAELRWPTDDESDVVATEGNQGPEKPVYMQHIRPGSCSDSDRGQNFRCGSLNVPLGANSYGTSLASQESPSQSQSIVLQTQAPYSSQGWSQTP